MKTKQRILSSRDLARSSHLLGLGIVTISLISGVMPQQLLATEVSLDNLLEPEHETGKLEKTFQSVNSSEVVVDISGSPNLEFKQSESVLQIEGLDKSSTVVDASILQNLEVELSESVTLSINSKNADNSISDNVTLQQSNISYKAADLQLESSINSVEGSMEEQLLAREVDLDTLCQLFPLNSRCSGYNPPVESQRQEQLRQQLRQTLAKRQPRSGYAVMGKVSTLGLGVEGIGAISPNFNGRVGVNYFDFGIDTEQSNINYDADLQLLSVAAMIDWFPSSKSGFHLTTGLLYNNNRVDATAQSTETLDIAGIEFPLSAVGQLEGELTFPNTIAPYLGIGYGNPVRQGRRFGFSIDLGLMFAGSPNVDLNASGPLIDPLLGAPVVGSLLENAIEEEEEDIEDDLSELGIYPVLSVGVSYQF